MDFIISFHHMFICQLIKLASKDQAFGLTNTYKYETLVKVKPGYGQHRVNLEKSILLIKSGA